MDTNFKFVKVFSSSDPSGLFLMLMIELSIVSTNKTNKTPIVVSPLLGSQSSATWQTCKHHSHLQTKQDTQIFKQI